MESSVRAQRFLQELGVVSAFAKGDRFLLVGPVYTLRRDADTRIRMIFARGEKKGEIQVGYASAGTTGGWTVVEIEPYTMRSFGYYQRRLKRIGDWHVTPPAEAFLEL
jgi:hypothetical protein